MLLLTKLLLLPSQQMDEDVDGDGCVCDCGSNVATIGVVVTLMIDPTSSGVTGLVQLLMVLLLLVPLLLLLLLMLMLFLSDSASGDHVVSHVALHVQSVVGMTGA